MIVGQIIFGPTITFAPKATIASEVRDLGLGVWKTLGLEVVVEPDLQGFPAPCFDVDEMRRRNELAKERARTLKSGG